MKFISMCLEFKSADVIEKQSLWYHTPLVREMASVFEKIDF